MSEFIISSEQLEQLIEGVEHDTGREINKVVYDGIELPKIVRCRDCAYICNREYVNGLEYHTCSYFDSKYAEVEPNGFCAWGERKVVGE